MNPETEALQDNARQELERYLEPLYERYKPFEARTYEGQWMPDEHIRDIVSDTDRHTDAVRYCLESIQQALDTGKTSLLARRFDDLFELSSAFELGLERQHETIENWLDILSIQQSEKLFEVKEPTIYLPELLIAVDDQLLRHVSKNPKLLYELNPRTFEELVAELFYRQGFEVQLTKRTRDGGRDIVALFYRLNVATKYIIECKRYAADRRVGLEIVHRLFGVKIAERANKAILATTSGFTKPALEFARSQLWDLDLKDYDDIANWLLPYANDSTKG